MDNGERVEGQEPLHRAGGPTDYLCAAAVQTVFKNVLQKYA
jgi:hypothetical protein